MNLKLFILFLLICSPVLAQDYLIENSSESANSQWNEELERIRKVSGLKATTAYVDTNIDLLNDKFDTTDGHDHDGTDSKKVIATNLDMTGLGIATDNVLYNDNGTIATRSLSNDIELIDHHSFGASASSNYTISGLEQGETYLLRWAGDGQTINVYANTGTGTNYQRLGHDGSGNVSTLDSTLFFTSSAINGKAILYTIDNRGFTTSASHCQWEEMSYSTVAQSAVVENKGQITICEGNSSCGGSGDDDTPLTALYITYSVAAESQLDIWLYKLNQS